MKKTTTIILCALGFFFSSCYSDDGTVPDPNPLPFENFNEFFAENRQDRDTLTFSSEELTTLAPIGGNTLTVAPEAFSQAGELSMAFLELTSKSDFVLYDLPTVQDGSWLQTSEAMFVEAFDGDTPIDAENPLGWELDLFAPTEVDDWAVYLWNDGWQKQSSIELIGGPNLVQFEADAGEGYLAGKALDVDAVELTINPTAYGSSPHDMRVYVVTQEGNTILPLEVDVSSVSAKGNVPKNMELDVIVMVMDYYRLSAGMSSVNLSSNSTIEVRLDKMEPSEMIDMIRQID